MINKRLVMSKEKWKSATSKEASKFHLHYPILHKKKKRLGLPRTEVLFHYYGVGAVTFGRAA